MTTTARHSVFCILVAVFGSLFASCSSSKPPVLQTSARIVESQHDIASLYADRRTASRERFIASAFTAAHRHWSLGCLVRCTILHNERWVVIRINDRGPYIRGRLIDLTPKAAEAIGLSKSHGICRVRIDRLQ